MTELITILEASKLLSCPRSAFYHLIEKGEITIASRDETTGVALIPRSHIEQMAELRNQNASDQWLSYEAAAELMGTTKTAIVRRVHRGEFHPVSWLMVPADQHVSYSRPTRSYLRKSEIEATMASSYRRCAVVLPQHHRVEDLCYLAGLFDGEGCVGLARNTPGKHPSCCVTILIANTYCDVIEWLKKEFGGSVFCTRLSEKPGSRRLDCYKWRATTAAAYQILRLIRPYLRIKHQQADIAIGFFERCLEYQGFGSRRVTPEEWAWRDEQRRLLHALNNPARPSARNQGVDVHCPLRESV